MDEVYCADAERLSSADCFVFDSKDYDIKFCIASYLHMSGVLPHPSSETMKLMTTNDEPVVQFKPLNSTENNTTKYIEFVSYFSDH